MTLFIEVLIGLKHALKGYKTYFIGLLMIGIGLYYQDKQLVLEGLGLITLRAGLKNVQN